MVDSTCPGLLATMATKWYASKSGTYVKDFNVSLSPQNKKVRPEEQMISALPDIKKITIEPEDEFMVLACDGIWNFMTSDDVVEFVQDRIADPTKKLTDICEEVRSFKLHNKEKIRRIFILVSVRQSEGNTSLA